MTIGNVYTKMGLYSDAIPFFEEAVAIRELELGEEHVEVAAALNDLGMAYLSSGDLEKAEGLPCPSAGAARSGPRPGRRRRGSHRLSTSAICCGAPAISGRLKSR